MNTGNMHGAQVLAFVGTLCFCLPVRGSPYEATNASVRIVRGINNADVVDVVAYKQLKAENDALRRENQMLRRELVANNRQLPDALLPEKAVAPNIGIEVPVEDTGFWISSKSGIRHNRRCRYYRKIKGRPCGQNDGKPCKKCGG